MAGFEKYHDNVRLDNQLHLETKTYCIRCRLCRNQLVVSDKVRFSHSEKKEGCGNCIFLHEEFLPDWIESEIENASWTKGRLKCSRTECTARVGGFDFVQGLLCGCGELTIPAIWIQDGKVDVRVVRSNDSMSIAKLSMMASDRSRLEDGTSITGVVDKNDVLSKAKEHSRHQSPFEDIGKTRKSDEQGQLTEDFVKMKQQSFCHAVTNGRLGDDILLDFSDMTETREREDSSSARIVQGSFGQEIEEIEDIKLLQSVDCERLNISLTDRTEISAGHHSSTSAHQRALAVRHRKCKVNRGDMVFFEQSRSEKVRITKPVKSELEEIGTTSSSSDHVPNRFEPLSVQEPAIVKPVARATLDAVVQEQEHLICAVCLDYFYKPYQCPCSHVFCEPCLRQLYHNRVGKLKCPVCRSTIRYIEPANDVREQVQKLGNPTTKQRELFEKKAKYRTWPLPPLGPLPFLRRRQTLVPKRDRNLIISTAVLLLIVCFAMLYIIQ